MPPPAPEAVKHLQKERAGNLHFRARVRRGAAEVSGQRRLLPPYDNPLPLSRPLLIIDGGNVLLRSPTPNRLMAAPLRGKSDPLRPGFQHYLLSWPPAIYRTTISIHVRAINSQSCDASLKSHDRF